MNNSDEEMIMIFERYAKKLSAVRAVETSAEQPPAKKAKFIEALNGVATGEPSGRVALFSPGTGSFEVGEVTPSKVAFLWRRGMQSVPF
ncbi:hypothetical protein AXF42_Ash012837 [Apostasia shenzhenica]|uniref:Uncharacterized protein n=1 Tax=Apostasia shenzhenica TaxID=1088818 RepID=A0A2I0AMC7_9ASPA|nr:hypothetical protein AXF42_Ash012837 [Apostasia shenzhenica]